MTPVLTETLIGSGAFILNYDQIGEGKFAFAVADLKTWLDAMAIGKRIIITHFARYSEETVAYWLAHGFHVEIADADNDNIPQSVLDRLAGVDRVFVASSPSDLTEYALTLDNRIFVACPRSPTQALSPDVHARATATYWMERFMFALPPAINVPLERAA
jgi:hypothetical protein